MIHRIISSGRTLLFGLALWAMVGGAAYAHKMNVFATADGTTVSGYAYTAGGDRVQGAAVEVSAPDGARLATLTTDDQGQFSYTPTVRCDQVITVSTTDGHRAVFTVAASELPDDLPLPAGEADAAAAEAVPPEEALTAEPTLPPAPGETAVSSELSSLRKQVVAMRVQLNRFQDRRSLQDVIGGVGYIFGIAGIAFYVLACRRKERPGGAPASTPGGAERP